MGLSDFSSRDKKVIAGGFAIWLTASVIGHFAQVFQLYGAWLEVMLNTLIMAAGLGAAYFLYKDSRKFGGLIGRGLTLLGIGIGYVGLMAVFHVYLHMNYPNLLPFFTFHHTALVVVGLIVAYALFLFYRGGKEWT